MKTSSELAAEFPKNAELVGDEHYYASAVLVSGYADFLGFIEHVQNDANSATGLGRLSGSAADAVAFVEWMADQPCRGNGSGKRCLDNTTDPAWQCPCCRASVLRYGT